MTTIGDLINSPEGMELLGKAWNFLLQNPLYILFGIGIFVGGKHIINKFGYEELPGKWPIKKQNIAFLIIIIIIVILGAMVVPPLL